MAQILAVILSLLSTAAPADQARTWLQESAAALGGEGKLRAMSAIELDGVSTLYQREQSERPEGPWVATYADFTDVRHFAADATRRTSRLRGYSTPDWVNNRDWLPPATTLIVSGVGLKNSNDVWTPAPAPWELATLPLAYEPERVILTALAARSSRRARRPAARLLAPRRVLHERPDARQNFHQPAEHAAESRRDHPCQAV